MSFSLVALALAALLLLSPQQSAPPSSQAPGAVSATGAVACEVEQVRMTWGFKESFRSYLSGAIALGKWTTGGDVGYEIPEFVFTGGVGQIAPDRKSGEVAFEGELRFTAHGGILNTALKAPRLEILGEREAALYFDISGETMGGLQVSQPALDFFRITWPASAETIDVQSGVFSVTRARVVLTPLGSGAFGTYLAGEVFDPLSFSIQVEPGCFTTGGFRWWWLPGGGLVLAALGGLGWFIATRVNKSRGLEHQ